MPSNHQAKNEIKVILKVKNAQAVYKKYKIIVLFLHNFILNLFVILHDY